ncbi:hypothetical protein MY579_01625 [Haemophilus influenzae]
MAKNKPTLPPRKWYSLQQAADKLTREFGEPVTVDDLLHYYQIDLLPFSIYINHNAERTCINDLVFSDSQKSENSMPISILKFDILNKLEELIIGKILYIEFAKKETESLILDSYKFKKSLHPDAKKNL